MSIASVDTLVLSVERVDACNYHFVGEFANFPMRSEYWKILWHLFNIKSLHFLSYTYTAYVIIRVASSTTYRKKEVSCLSFGFSKFWHWNLCVNQSFSCEKCLSVHCAYTDCDAMSLTIASTWQPRHIPILCNPRDFYHFLHSCSGTWKNVQPSSQQLVWNTNMKTRRV